ncbi:MAG TPA: hypothetical protein VFB70_17345 [Pyrinomonadaceae bacterium]|jgi:hypothetical protein|nr:hypothetical protein [Pyrinomonadaceae bacterium]
MSRFAHFKALLFFVCLLAFAPATYAQTPAPTPTVVLPPSEQPRLVTSRSSLYCTGYIQHERMPRMPEIVGAEEEQEQRKYSDGDFVYLNAGSQQGIKEGQTFQIIRPRGDVKGVHKTKSGFIGTYVQDVGQLQVFKVRENTSAAQVTFACDQILLGDLLAPVPDRESPVQRAEESLDRFTDPSGKQHGRLMMAKDGREMVTRHDIVYIDLGAEDQVKRGDYLTIYRPLGTGDITRVGDGEITHARSAGFQSDRYRGGGFSNQAARVNAKQVKRDRPSMPRKVVGEMVVLDVQTRTATAIITRVASEVHTGDWVEIQ